MSNGLSPAKPRPPWIATGTHNINICIRSTVPGKVIGALRQHRGKYTDMEDIFHCIEIGTDHWVGVAGTGGDGSYEWFSLRGDEFECSEKGYGETAIALRDVLVKKVY